MRGLLLAVPAFLVIGCSGGPGADALLGEARTRLEQAESEHRGVSALPDGPGKVEALEEVVGKHQEAARLLELAAKEATDDTQRRAIRTLTDEVTSRQTRLRDELATARRTASGPPATRRE